jgi:hypothetical protein
MNPKRTLAGLAGLALGFSLLLSLDGLVYLLPVIPFCGLIVIGRRPEAAPFLIGFVVGVGYGMAGAFLLDRPFADTIGPTVALAGVVAVWLIAACIVVLQLTKWSWVRSFVPKWLARRPLRWLPEVGSALAVAALIGFAVRPYVQTVRGHPSASVRAFIAGLQRLQGLPVDPTRLYSEQTLYWVIWYIGLPTVLLAAFGIALLVRRCLRALITWRDPTGIWRAWGLPLTIICGSAAVLWRPDIVPDQPWASRRLVVMVLPGLTISALLASAWLTRQARERGARRTTAALAGLFCSAAMLVPTVSTTFGLGLSHTGSGDGLRPAAQGMALRQTGGGEAAAVRDLCAQIPRKASVVVVDWATADRFGQVVRGMCGVPVALMVGQPAAAVDNVISGIMAAGRRPVLLASGPGPLAGYGASPVRVLDLLTTQDPHQLTQLPTVPGRIRYVVWMATPTTAGVGA